jgi:hypothetical protein
MITREINYVDALLSLAPGACWSSDGTLEGLDWIDKNIERPTNEAIRAEVSRLAEQQKANAYRVARSGKYPPIGDQLDALYRAGVFPADMAEKIQAVKDEFPKP